MQFYSAKVRLKGDVRHEVLKSHLSTPEIYILRILHGDDAVIDVKPSGGPVENFDHVMERERLHKTYGEGLSSLEEKTSVSDLFGRGFSPLPEAIPEARKPREAKIPEKQPEIKSTAANPRRKRKTTPPIGVPAVSVPKVGADNKKEGEALI